MKFGICLVICKIILYLIFGIGLPSVCIYCAEKYHGQCPIQPYIIVYLYVSAAFCMLRGVLGLIEQTALLCGEEEFCTLLCIIPDVIIGLFLFCWFITGAVWVYTTKSNHSRNPLSADYCDPDLLIIAQAVLGLQWLILPLTYRRCGGNSGSSGAAESV